MRVIQGCKIAQGAAQIAAQLQHDLCHGSVPPRCAQILLQRSQHLLAQNDEIKIPVVGFGDQLHGVFRPAHQLLEHIDLIHGTGPHGCCQLRVRAARSSQDGLFQIDEFYNLFPGGRGAPVHRTLRTGTDIFSKDAVWKSLFQHGFGCLFSNDLIAFHNEFLLCFFRSYPSGHTPR